MVFDVSNPQKFAFIRLCYELKSIVNFTHMLWRVILSHNLFVVILHVY